MGPGSRIVMTGGARFLGSHLVDRLLTDTAADVVVLANMKRGRWENLSQHRENPRLQGFLSSTRWESQSMIITSAPSR